MHIECGGREKGTRRVDGQGWMVADPLWGWVSMGRRMGRRRSRSTLDPIWRRRGEKATGIEGSRLMTDAERACQHVYLPCKIKLVPNRP
jgi:hypothetical protein